MQKVIFFIGFMFVFLSTNFFAQNKTDSLLKLIKTTKHDTVKVICYNSLFLQLEFEDDIKARTYLDSALKLAYRIKHKKGLSTTYMHLGYSEEDHGQYQEALKNYSLSLKVSQEIKDKKSIGAAANNIGNVYYNQANYPEALKNYFTSLKMREAINDSDGVAGSYTNIGLVYLHQGNYTEALKNYEKGLKLYKEIGNKEGVGIVYSNIGLVYFYLANYPESLNNYLAALKIAEEQGNNRGIADCYNYIGGVYDMQKKHDEALKSYFAALKMNLAIGNQKGIASCYGNIGISYTKQKKYNLGQDYLLKAEEILKNIGAKANLKLTYVALAFLDSSKGDFKNAYKHHKLFIQYRDSIDNEITRKKTVESQMTFDFEKKEAVAKAEHQKEIEHQKALSQEKSRKQLIVIGFVVISLILVLIFAVYVLRSLRLTRIQKNVIEQQKHILEEHQKEIIDSITYAKRLQQAILPSNDEIKKHLPEHFILYHPKDIVAGDFYWMHVVSDYIFIAAADSTGHGVPGAMVSVVCSNALNRAVDEFHLTDTGKILNKTRELVLETFAKSGEEIKDGMDISLIRIQKDKTQSIKEDKISIQWSGANNPLWYIRTNEKALTELVEVKADKQPIGKTDNPKPFTTHSLELHKGDVFYLMTDGYADQFGGPKGKKYKYKALGEKLINTHHLSIQLQYEELTNSFNNWKGNLEQVDDVTIIGIKV